MSKLYKLSEQFKNLEELLENDDLPKELIQDALNDVQASIEEKIIGMCSYIKNLESDVVGVASEVKRLSDKKKAMENKIDSIKSYMYENLKSLNMQKVRTSIFSVAIQKNQKALKITDGNKIPIAYVLPQEVKFDKKAILADIKNGQVIEGVEVMQSESIRIR